MIIRLWILCIDLPPNRTEKYKIGKCKVLINGLLRFRIDP